MKTTHSLLAALMLLLAIPTFSQEDIRSEIMNYHESDFNFINKARRLLGNHIKDGNTVEAAKVKDTLLDEYNGEVLETFYNWEYIFLLYSLGEYDTLLNFMEVVDFDNSVSSNVSTSAQTDNLGTLLRENMLAYYDIIEIDIKESIEDAMSRDFLLLMLQDIAHITPPRSQEREEHTQNINKLANQYLKNHPDSPYDKTVREQIRFEFAEANWGFYWDFGFGVGINNGKLGENLNGTGFGMEMILEYRYKKVLGQFELGFTSKALSNDISVNNTTWMRESYATIGSYTLNAGYLLLENKRWSIYPLAGIGYANVEADSEDYKEDPRLKKLRINSFYPQVGVGIDFKFFMPDPYTSVKSPLGRFSLQYKYKMFNFENDNPLFQGHQHVIMFTYGIGGRPMKRKM